MAAHSSVLAWRIPWVVEPGGLPSIWSHRVGHDWSDLAAAAAAAAAVFLEDFLIKKKKRWHFHWAAIVHESVAFFNVLWVEVQLLFFWAIFSRMSEQQTVLDNRDCMSSSNSLHMEAEAVWFGFLRNKVHLCGTWDRHAYWLMFYILCQTFNFVLEYSQITILW